MAEVLGNLGKSTLASSMNNSQTTLTVQSGDGAKFPATGNFRVTVESEIMICTSRATDVLTVTRGQEGTTAASHGANIAVAHTLTKAGLDAYLAQVIPALPSGVIAQFAGAAAPSGWVLCDGTSYLRSGGGVDALFAAIGTTYGAADGTHFNVPDFRGRAAFGKGSNAALSSLGANEGVAEANRRPQHRHTAHRHAYHSGTNNGSSYGPNAEGLTLTPFASAPLGTDLADGGSGVGTDALDGPAFLAVNYIIKI
jgi:microcystin-dependent protein